MYSDCIIKFWLFWIVLMKSVYFNIIVINFNMLFARMKNRIRPFELYYNEIGLFLNSLTDLSKCILSFFQRKGAFTLKNYQFIWKLKIPWAIKWWFQEHLQICMTWKRWKVIILSLGWTSFSTLFSLII